MRRLVFLVCAWAFAAGTAAGQAAPTADQIQTIQALLERIDKLEKRVEELENTRGPQPAASLTDARFILPTRASLNPAVSESRPVQDPGGHSERAAVPRAERNYPSLQIRGFADIDFSATDQKGSISGFNLGQFALHLSSPLSKKVSYFGEISFTAQPTGYAVEVERSVIRYDYNDFFKLSFGRYHTPINYWNTAFHHGLWLQTTISRPEMVQFGGRFLPTHFIGLLAEGNIPSGGAGLSYNIGLGNGRASIISRAGDAGDSNNNRAWVVNIFSRPSRLYGLQVGGSVYRDKITQVSGPDVGEWIASAHVIWTKENPEFLSEFANVHHRNQLTGHITNSQAFYVQVAYRFPWMEKRWKPYYRFEHIHVPAGEPVLGVPNLVGSTVGLRYDISDYAAFKGEYRATQRQAGTPRANGVFFQTSFTF
jgi:hypothetical protein